jgi:hypothetical protein
MLQWFLARSQIIGQHWATLLGNFIGQHYWATDYWATGSLPKIIAPLDRIVDDIAIGGMKPRRVIVEPVAWNISLPCAEVVKDALEWAWFLRFRENDICQEQVAVQLHLTSESDFTRASLFLGGGLGK